MYFVLLYDMEKRVFWINFDFFQLKSMNKSRNFFHCMIEFIVEKYETIKYDNRLKKVEY